MAYSVKEVYYTLQGEGFHTGRPAVFLRFAGCNLWSGREKDRETAVCRFCDTDFNGTDGDGGGQFESAATLSDHVHEVWGTEVNRFVVCTGGEPLLQLDAELIDALHARDFEVAVETNGTLETPPGIDWLCVSPKAGSSLVLLAGDELKLVYRQAGALPIEFERLAFDHFYLQPMDGPELPILTEAAIEYCLKHPRWKLSLQIHKILGLP